MILTLDEALAVIRKSASDPGSVTCEQLAQGIDAVVEATRLTYEQEAESYEQLRGAKPSEDDLYMDQILLNVVRERISQGLIPTSDDLKWRLLDVGAGYGRDVKLFNDESDISVSAVENCLPFLNTLRQQSANGEIKLDMIIDADMRDLSAIPDGSFECVRNNATLHHLPLAACGLGADSAISESRRILVDGGVFQCLVKEGTGVEMTDTGEGLGRRFYQYFSADSLSTLLTRHELRVVDCKRFTEWRPAGDVNWLMMLAYAG